MYIEKCMVLNIKNIVKVRLGYNIFQYFYNYVNHLFLYKINIPKVIFLWFK